MEEANWIIKLLLEHSGYLGCLATRHFVVLSVNIDFAVSLLSVLFLVIHLCLSESLLHTLVSFCFFLWSFSMPFSVCVGTSIPQMMSCEASLENSKRERARKTGIILLSLSSLYVCVCVCVCVTESERPVSSLSSYSSHSIVHLRPVLTPAVR